MHYIRQSLGQDEKLIHVAQFHWVYNFLAFFNVIFSVVLAIGIVVIALKFEPMIFKSKAYPVGTNWLFMVQNLHPGVKITAFIVILLGILRFVHMMIIKATTEIAITNRRLVYKRGLIARYVGEMNVDRVEGINVLQGILGRMLGYGRVMVRGMGVGEVVLPPISDPIRFRKAIEHARDSRSGQAERV